MLAPSGYCRSRLSRQINLYLQIPVAAFERNRSCALPFAMPKTSYGCRQDRRRAQSSIGQGAEIAV